MLQTDTYILLHRSLEVATTTEDLEILLRRFQAVYDATKDCFDRDDLFDAAWAMSCLAGLYERLHEPFLAEHAYIESIKRFKDIHMALPAAAVCEDLAKFLADHGRTIEAEAKLEEELSCLEKLDDQEVPVQFIEEELATLRLTGKIVEACHYEWYLPYEGSPDADPYPGEIRLHNDDGWTNQSAA